MSENELNYRNLLIALIREKKTLSVILKGQVKFDKLLKELNKHNIDGYDPLPKQKDLLKTMGMKREELITLMREMYNKFCSEISRDGNYPIIETEIFICASNVYDAYWVLSPDQLAYLPDVGNWITIPFFRDKFGGGHFKVQEVNHEIERQKHTITIIVDDDIGSEY